jgi:hypothetical protein
MSQQPAASSSQQQPAQLLWGHCGLTDKRKRLFRWLRLHGQERLRLLAAAAAAAAAVQLYLVRVRGT